jgi:hypothetical protein
MASTKGGMRRILKRKLPVHVYIQKAVETGVYRSNEELEKVWRERRDSADDLRTIMRRFRQDIVRGSNVHDYPIEYRILKQHPPIPDPPRIPKRIARRMKEPENPTERLVRKILNRQDKVEEDHRKQRPSSMRTTPTMTTDEYYRRLFGMNTSGGGAAAAASSHLGPSTIMSQKPAGIQKAYAAAVKCYQLQRTEGMTEDEALRRVDEILLEQDKKERDRSAQRRDLVVEFSKEQERQQQQKEKQSRVVRKDAPLSTRPSIKSESVTKKEEDEDAASSSSTSTSSDSFSDIASSSSSPFSSPPSATSATMIFADNPRAVEGMMMWGERLARVPYSQWTVGASTALDHWIARQVLRLSEETWQLLLEGSDPSLLSVGRDVVRVRESLFPETAPIDLTSSSSSSSKRETVDENVPDDSFFSSSSRESEPEKDVSGEKSIEELLASLGGLTLPPKADKAARDATGDEDEDDAVDLDIKVQKLVGELQDWRRKNVDRPYRDWSDQDREAFDAWMRGYIRAVSSSSLLSSDGAVDYEATRQALLSQPPLPDREDSDAFWNQLQDDRDALALLEVMRRDGPPLGASYLHAAFWDLPYESQLDQLLNLGALRPLVDEYTKESNRSRFLRRYGDTLLEGVELEHLVSDPDGPIRASDLGPLVAASNRNLRVRSDERFRLELIPYRSSPPNLSAREKTRALFALWNQHKAGRARYEEKLFRTGQLGLRYDDVGDDHNNHQDDAEEEDAKPPS